MRLIDEQTTNEAVRKVLRKYGFSDESVVSDEIWDCIENTETAYDVDKVVAQLEQQISKNKDLYKNNKICLEESIDREVCYSTAIDFVKAGGV